MFCVTFMICVTFSWKSEDALYEGQKSSAYIMDIIASLKYVSSETSYPIPDLWLLFGRIVSIKGKCVGYFRLPGNRDNVSATTWSIYLQWFIQISILVSFSWTLGFFCFFWFRQILCKTCNEIFYLLLNVLYLFAPLTPCNVACNAKSTVGSNFKLHNFVCPLQEVAEPYISDLEILNNKDFKTSHRSLNY